MTKVNKEEENLGENEVTNAKLQFSTRNPRGAKVKDGFLRGLPPF